ncbi:MAG: hypothetical protein L3J66_02080 [Bacteroidales bacterium]|nr:hypothetical protein [Bacteroidales bacterium]
MTTFHPITLVCPHCGMKMSDYELMSFTIHRSTAYSDGMTVTEPWMNNDKAITLCPDCQQVFWRDDAIEESDNYPEEELPMARDMHDLPFAFSDTFREELIRFYVKLLKDGFANTTEKKEYLRFRIWWGINNFIRYRKPFWKLLPRFKSVKQAKNLLANRKKNRETFAVFKPVFEENLKNLIAIYQPEHEGEQIMLAEMYRELGEMAKAKEVLNEVEDKAGCRKIRIAVHRNRKRVMKL